MYLRGAHNIKYIIDTLIIAYIQVPLGCLRSLIYIAAPSSHSPAPGPGRELSPRGAALHPDVPQCLGPVYVFLAQLSANEGLPISTNITGHFEGAFIQLDCPCGCTACLRIDLPYLGSNPV